MLWLVVGTTLLRLGFAATTGLGVDESYMVTAGRVLSLGYFDHPPVSWWLSWGAAHLFGSEVPVVVRLPFILLFALSQVLMGRIGSIVGGPKAGFWAVVALNVSPVFGITTGTWVLPDGPLDAALLGAVLCLMLALDGRGLRWWVAAGACAGLALLSKYSAVLSVAGVCLYLLTADRRWFGRLGPYLALVAAVAVFSPVLVWNAAHGWASFVFQGDRALGGRLHPLAPFAVLGGEALFVLPWIWLPMVMLLVRGEGDWRQRLLAWVAAPPIVVFALVSVWSSQRVLYHWAAPGYLMLFPVLGAAIAARIERPWVRRVVGASVVLVLGALVLIAGQMQFDWLGGGLAAVMRRDPTAEGLDWVSVRQDLAARGLLHPGQPVAAFNWRDAGKFGVALGPAQVMLCLNSDDRQFGFAEPARSFVGQDLLLLSAGPPGPALREAEARFDSVQELPPVAIMLNGRVLGRVTVMVGYGLKGAASSFASVE